MNLFTIQWHDLKVREDGQKQIDKVLFQIENLTPKPKFNKRIKRFWAILNQTL